MAQVTLDHLSKSFGSTHVLNDVSLTVADGEFLVLVGPSGCGKSTVLRVIAGLEAPTEGSIQFDGNCIDGLSPKDRDVAMVFQNYALYPHMSVFDNLAFALKMRKEPKPVIAEKVAHVANMLQLEPLLQRKPKQLSGGQRQRVALGRAIVRNPNVFLMDEPLSNLDAKLRLATRQEIKALHQKLGVTTLYVTHDQEEALTLGDRVAVLSYGLLQQCDTPLTVYNQPANVFVATFMGPMNLLPAMASGQTVCMSDTRIVLPPQYNPLPEKITLGFRPEQISLVPIENALALAFTAQHVEQLGHSVRVHGTTTDKHALQITASHWPASNTPSQVFIELSSLCLFDAETQRAISNPFIT
ncbi:MAG: ABC transporter ATP-binding protein [Vampirovibrionales bacterium]|nr:ABC transporter ATP-binding protein [Vampirovibrionales bacterium]